MIIDYILLGVLVFVLAIQIIFVVLLAKNKSKSSPQKPFNVDEVLNVIGQTNKMQIDAIKNYTDGVSQFLSQNMNMQRANLQDIQLRLEKILTGNEQKLDGVKQVISDGLTKLQYDNEKKLEQMRQTVDEKLNVSLERRLGESFSLISSRLEAVYRGLGEMQSLANGVGDLKKVLTNVKTRGVWGEVSLLNLLEQILTSGQFERNVATKPNTQERVDFAIKLPGKDNETVLLPIDAKFPLEDYQRLVDASEHGVAADVEQCQKALERRVKDEAKSICEKYINVPQTTDFALMYLPIEGLYAEIAKNGGLIENLQQNFKVVVCGPSTISALLNSLQLGFKTLSIEKRSSEIWQLLGVFKKEFELFSNLLAKTQKKLEEASSTIESATKKTNTIAKKLKSITVDNSQPLLQGFDETDEVE